MAELIPENYEPNSQSTTFAIEGTTIVPKSIPRKNKDVPDILTWVECFNSYTAVLTTFFPTQSRDLLAYMAHIIRTAKRFGGMSWLSYDRAFRSEAAASDLRDWSLMKPDLYNYHTRCSSSTHFAWHLAMLSPQPTWLSPRAPGGTVLPAAVYLVERRLMHQSKRTLSRRAPPMNVKGPTDESTIGLPHPTSETDHQITITPSLLQVIRSLLTPLPLWNMSHLVLCTLSVNSLD